MDTVEKLTIYVDKKNNLDQFENVVIKDRYNDKDSRIIYAKSGFFSQLNDQNFLVLSESKILNINKGKTTIINFNKTQLNLSDYSSKTTKYPKLQEVSIFILSKCLFQPKDQRSQIIFHKKFLVECLNLYISHY